MFPKSIYIHLPFCKSICPYCDFASYANKNADIHLAYLTALKKEIAIFLETYVEEADLEINTIFFGGGTPSIHSASEIEGILDELKKYLKFSDEIEITLEANPGTVDLDKLYAFKSIGINRLSIGAQSFNQTVLNKLARGHTVDETFDVINMIKQVGFKSWSFDLIYGLPLQSFNDWLLTLDEALSFGSPHLSAYALSVEANTPFGTIYATNKQDLADENMLADMYAACNDLLKTADLERYEVSNWAKAGHESKHNLCYWHADEYLAFGLSAHGYFRGYRFAHTRSLDKYIDTFNQDKVQLKAALEAGSLYETYNFISEKEALEEKIMLNLRLSSGLQKDEAVLRLLDREKVEIMLAKGLLIENERSLTLSEQGFFISNGVISYCLKSSS